MGYEPLYPSISVQQLRNRTVSTISYGRAYSYYWNRSRVVFSVLVKDAFTYAVAQRSSTQKICAAGSGTVRMVMGEGCVLTGGGARSPWWPVGRPRCQSRAGRYRRCYYPSHRPSGGYRHYCRRYSSCIDYLLQSPSKPLSTEKPTGVTPTSRLNDRKVT